MDSEDSGSAANDAVGPFADYGPGHPAGMTPDEWAVMVEELREEEYRARQDEEAAEAAAEKWDRAWHDAQDRSLRLAARNPKYRRTSWWPQDLRDAVGAGPLPDPPTILQRTDDRFLIYDGLAHVFYGASGSLKTHAALLAVADLLRRGLAVLYIDMESDRFTIARWLIHLGVPENVILRQFLYVHPDEPLESRDRWRKPGRDFFGHTDLFLVGGTFDARFVVIDGVTEFMALHGLNSNAGEDVSTYQQLLLRSPKLHGVTRLAVDHTPHGVSRQIGSQHKGAGIDGATYFFKADHLAEAGKGRSRATGCSQGTP